MKRLLVFLILVAGPLGFSACSPSSLFNSKSGLQVLTNDIPSKVFLDGEELGNTPLIDKELNAGEYTLMIQPEDQTLVSYETSVKLNKGLLTVVTWKPGTRAETSGGVIYEMEKLSSGDATELSIVSIPDRAIITLDGGEAEFAPYTVEGISPGQHEFEVKLPSFESQKHSINVLKGHRVNVSVKLAKVEGETFNPDSEDLTSPDASDSAEATDSAEVDDPKSSASPEPTSQPEAGTVTIKSTGFLQNGKEVLRVRDTAGLGGKELGFAPVGESYEYLQETTAGWHKIEFNGEEGWVSSQYTTLNK